MPRPEITGRLENWSYDEFYNVIWGEIHNDARKRFADGTKIHTSSIPGGRDLLYQKGSIVKTLNSQYELGNPRVFDE